MGGRLQVRPAGGRSEPAQRKKDREILFQTVAGEPSLEKIRRTAGQPILIVAREMAAKKAKQMAKKTKRGTSVGEAAIDEVKKAVVLGILLLPKRPWPPSRRAEGNGQSYKPGCERPNIAQAGEKKTARVLHIERSNRSTRRGIGKVGRKDPRAAKKKLGRTKVRGSVSSPLLRSSLKTPETAKKGSMQEGRRGGLKSSGGVRGVWPHK